MDVCLGWKGWCDLSETQNTNNAHIPSPSETHPIEFKSHHMAMYQQRAPPKGPQFGRPMKLKSPQDTCMSPHLAFRLLFISPVTTLRITFPTWTSPKGGKYVHGMVGKLSACLSLGGDKSIALNPRHILLLDASSNQRDRKLARATITQNLKTSWDSRV